MSEGTVKTATKRYRGYTLSKVSNAIQTEYEYFMATGEQDGVLNLVGPAGIGKTAIVYQLAETMREKGHGACKVIELYLSALMDPESAAGTPIPIDFMYKGESVKALSLASRTELLEALAPGRGGILFIDEMGREADQMRPLIMKLLHEKMLGGLDVSNFFILVAGNPSDEEHNAVAIQEDAAISSRLTDIPVKADVGEMSKYFYRFTKSHQAVADFLLDHPDYMHGRDSHGDQSSKFHSPRSWFNAGSKLHLHGGGNEEMPGNIKKDDVSMTITGTVGPQAYSALKTFMSAIKVLSLTDILEGKFTAPIRSIPASTQQALKAWLTEQKLTNEQADHLVAYLDAVPADMARTIMREAQDGNILTHNQRKLVARNAFTKFVTKMARISGGPQGA